MKIIFLDIDGVLNNRKTIAAAKGFKSFDSECVSLLNWLVSESGAKIVISSNWRLYPYDFEELFANQRIVCEIYDHTPIINDFQNGIFRAVIRGAEIGEWLRLHPETEKFVILDDDADMGELLPNLVQTSMDTGLTFEHTKKALEMLGRIEHKESEISDMLKGMSENKTPRYFA